MELDVSSEPLAESVAAARDAGASWGVDTLQLCCRMPTPFARVAHVRRTITHRAASGDARLHHPPNAPVGTAAWVRACADDSRPLERHAAGGHRIALPGAPSSRARQADRRQVGPV